MSEISEFSESTPLVVTPQAFLTLHYRLLNAQGEVIISTFNEGPATLQLGQNQLAPQLETALLGLAEGTHTVLTLQPENAFGARNPDLVQRVSLTTLKENSAMDNQYAVGDMVEFAAPSGGKFAGILRELDEEGAIFDFNHPLAGQILTFEIKLIAIL